MTKHYNPQHLYAFVRGMVVSHFGSSVNDPKKLQAMYNAFDDVTDVVEDYLNNKAANLEHDWEWNIAKEAEKLFGKAPIVPDFFFGVFKDGEIYIGHLFNNKPVTTLDLVLVDSRGKYLTQNAASEAAFKLAWAGAVKECNLELFPTMPVGKEYILNPFLGWKMKIEKIDSKGNIIPSI